MGKTQPRIRNQSFSRPGHKKSVIFSTVSVIGFAAIATVGVVKGGWNIWGLDEDCTNEEAWRQLGLRPPCGNDTMHPRHEYDPGRATTESVHGPDGTPDWFTAQNLTITLVLCGVAYFGIRTLRRRGEGVVAA